mgnify:CR=1 FL=1
MKVLSALGAYGRYPSREDWDAGKDFRAYQGAYFSIRDVKMLKEMWYTRIDFKHGGHVVFSVEL